MHIVSDRPHFVPDHMPKVTVCPYFVSDRMLSRSPKCWTAPILYRTVCPKCQATPILFQTSCFTEAKCQAAHFMPNCMLNVLDCLYFVSDRMLSRSKIPVRPHFVLDCPYFQRVLWYSLKHISSLSLSSLSLSNTLAQLWSFNHISSLSLSLSLVNTLALVWSFNHISYCESEVYIVC
ncbi:hypothetical protein AMTRI_Chr08g209600 [Amborella trichopoda]